MGKLSQGNETLTMNFIAHSAAGRQAYYLAQRVANFNVATLITGETGTGKECIARVIHQFSVG